MANNNVSKIDLHLETLPLVTRNALEQLSMFKWFKKSKWYLAGGTALALQIGHRSSMDLDFFIPQTDFNAGKLLKHFANKNWKLTLLKEGTIYGEWNGTKVSFIAYPFFVPSKNILYYKNIRVLSLKDIAVMKLIAVSQRGKKRDFIDLYWYAKNVEPLYDVLLRLRRQYPRIEHNYHHIIKSLSYFADAENEPEPKLFFKASWQQVKNFFVAEVKMLARKFKFVSGR